MYLTKKTVFFLTFLFKEGASDLKRIIENLNIDEVNAEIQKELSIF